MVVVVLADARIPQHSIQGFRFAFSTLFHKHYSDHALASGLRLLNMMYDSMITYMQHCMLQPLSERYSRPFRAFPHEIVMM